MGQCHQASKRDFFFEMHSVRFHVRVTYNLAKELKFR